MKAKKNLIDRWGGRCAKIEAAAPFGLTEGQLRDLRGMQSMDLRLSDLEIALVDLSHANLDRLQAERCLFRSCRFDGAILTRWSLTACRFEDCSFALSDMRGSIIGHLGTEFKNCSFEKSRLARTIFVNPVFVGVAFDGKVWSHINFGAAGFWSCSFSGILTGCVFYGDYLFRQDRENYGHPQRTGFHAVSLRRAELQWCGFARNFVFESVVLPEQGTTILCQTADLKAFDQKYRGNAKLGALLSRYLDIVSPGLVDQQQTLVSKHDVVGKGDLRLGSELFDLMKNEIAVPIPSMVA